MGRLSGLGLALMLVGWLAPALAQETDGVAADGLLADEDFFRLATCGAPPGGDCQTPIRRWPKPMLTLALSPELETTPPGFADRIALAVDHALAEINGAGAGITIQPTARRRGDITIRPTSIREGTRLGDVPGFSGRGVMGVGYMTFWSDDQNRITEAVILISTEITDQDLTSVMLEEITQSLGILYDIEGPAYEGLSILSQTSNATTTIAGQDAALLRWLYPPQD